MDRIDLEVIKDSFGRVVFTHKTHEKAAEREETKNCVVKWVNISLTVLTLVFLLIAIISNSRAFLYCGATLTAVTVGFLLFQLSFDPARIAEKHRATAKELWYVREKYENLIADILNMRLTGNEICAVRDHLSDKLGTIYKFAPQTDAKSYAKARCALNIEDEMTFSDEEINRYLPESLRK
jgi:hypothetical protein